MPLFFYLIKIIIFSLELQHLTKLKNIENLLKINQDTNKYIMEFLMIEEIGKLLIMENLLPLLYMLMIVFLGLILMVLNISSMKWMNKNMQMQKGKSIMRNYCFPDSVKEDNFKYGIGTSGGNIKNKIINIKKFQF